MRFLLDQNVDARVRSVFTSQGHECWTVAEANLSRAKDDDLTIYAMGKGAVLVTHDVEFSQRRQANTHGRHLQLACDEPDAVDLLTKHFADIVDACSLNKDVFVRISQQGCTRSFHWS